MKRSLFFILFTFAVKTWGGLVGTWESVEGQGYADYIFWGTFNFKFSAENQVETFLQYYDINDHSKKLSIEPLLKGTYTITKQPADGGDGEYNLEVYFNGRAVRLYKIVIKENNMTIYSDKPIAKSYKKLP